MDFGKGHGTENDFVLIPDLDVRVDLTVKAVSALCDRRRGLGADGVLRIARAGDLHASGVLRVVPAGIADDDWFMDYRNADGSIAEMCGNGVRVFAHYLRAHGLEDRDRFVVGSRAGARPVTVHKVEDARADVTVGMGDLALLGASSAQLSDRTFDGIGIDVGNPHLACVDPALTTSTLRTLDFTDAPRFDREFFPDGVNLEVLTRLDRGRVDMRVYERGVGETRSCGTGTVAAAAAALSYEGRDSGEVTVGVLGGEVFVTIDDDGAHLRGPSILVASGVIDDEWLRDIS